MKLELFKGDFTDKQIKEQSNGCGTDGWKGALVPDTIWFLNVSEACNIHDCFYYYAKPRIQDKIEADRIFLNNLIRIIDAGTKWKWLKRRRYKRAQVYYEAVFNFGGPAFWEDKNIKFTIE